MMATTGKRLLQTLLLTSLVSVSTATGIVSVGQRSLGTSTAILVVCDGPLDPTTAQSASRYTVSGGRTVSSAALHPGAANIVQVTLNAATPLQPGAVYTLTMNGVMDTTSAVVSPNSRTFTVRSVATEIANIQASQLPAGAISQNAPYGPPWQPAEPVRVVPYFACNAAQGLIFGERITGDRTLLEPVWNYLVWHAARLSPTDGTISDYGGTAASYLPKGDFDSSDSYGALFLTTLWMWYQDSEDRARLAIMTTAIDRAVAAMALTMEPDNLTWAKPTYRIKYTMDNSEVFQGYFAAAQLASELGLAAKHDEWLAQADAVRAAILTNLYDEAAPAHYVMALDEANAATNDWSLYEFDGMANAFALYYVHQPGDERAAVAWASGRARFVPGNVPDANVNWSLPLTAVAFADSTTRDATYPTAFATSLAVQDRNAHESARFIEIEYLERPYAAVVPSTRGSAIAIDGVLDEPAWRTAAKLRFHKHGRMVGLANAETYEFPVDVIDPDGVYTLYLANNGTVLYVGLEARDASIAAAAVPQDSDGLSHLWIRDHAAPTTLHDVSYTFFPGTTPSAPAGTSLFRANSARRNWKRTATGYTMEFRIDLAEADFGAYPSGTREVTVGLRIADMDGTPGIAWPWDNGAYGTMMQLRAGLSPDDYAKDVLLLADPAYYAEPTSTYSDRWLIN